jgi:hypothetical protein
MNPNMKRRVPNLPSMGGLPLRMESSRTSISSVTNSTRRSMPGSALRDVREKLDASSASLDSILASLLESNSQPTQS